MAANPPDSSDAPGGRDGVDLRLVEAPAVASDGSEASFPRSDRADAPEPGRKGSGDPQPGWDGESSGSTESGRTGIPRWIFMLTVLLLVAVILWQVRHAGELEARVAGLESELAHARALVEAQRAHLGEIRGGVHALSERVEALQDLVDRDPMAIGTDSGASLDSPPAP